MSARSFFHRHLDECEDCAADRDTVEQVEAAFDVEKRSGEAGVNALRLRTVVLDSARGELAERARTAYVRRAVSTVAAASLPLPVVLAAGFYALRGLHGVLALWMPAGVAGYVVAAYAATTALVFGLTYAAIPLLVDRAATQQAGHGRIHA